MTIAYYVKNKNESDILTSMLDGARIKCEVFDSENVFLRFVRRETYDLILIDTGGDLESEERFFSWLNCRNGASTPVVILSDLNDPLRIARALEAGADDFVAKPFYSMELLARINAVMRRSKRCNSEKKISLSGFILDQDRCTVHDRGTLIELTPREFTMAWLFFSSPGTYLSRETISMAIWGVECDIANRTIEQHVYKLRKKLNLSAERGVTIRTGYTQGYRIELVRDKAVDVDNNVHSDEGKAIKESSSSLTKEAAKLTFLDAKIKNAGGVVSTRSDFFSANRIEKSVLLQSFG